MFHNLNLNVIVWMLGGCLLLSAEQDLASAWKKSWRNGISGLPAPGDLLQLVWK